MGNKIPSWRSDKRTASERGYDSRWHKARATFLRDNPLCVMCRDEGQVREATVVDHIVPHKGDQKLFWASENWQPLCKQHHDSDKKLLENGSDPRTKFTPDGRVIW